MVGRAGPVIEQATAEDLLRVVGDGELELTASEQQFVRDLFAGNAAQIGNESVRGAVVRRLCMHAGMVDGGQPGRLSIDGGSIEGDLDLTGLRLDFGLQFSGTRLAGLVLRDTRLLALELLGGSATGIAADRVEIAHDILITDEFNCSGAMWLRSGSIGGDLNCEGSSFVVAQGPSINLDGARIGGRIYLQRKGDFAFHANHGVYGRNMRVAGGVMCNEGRFDRELNLTRTHIQGDLRLGDAEIGAVPAQEGQEPDAALSLGAMQIDGELSLRGTDYRGPTVILDRTHVERSLRWSLKRTEPKAEKLTVDLMQAEIGYLHDDLDRWHGAEVRLDGFSFEGVAIRGSDWLEQRKQWLDRQPEGKWSPYPYDQLRAALRSSGYEAAARDIAVERERVRQSKGRLGRLGRLAHLIYGALLGYGYKPLRFFFISAVVVVAFAFFFAHVPSCGPHATAASCDGFAFPVAHAATYHSLLFSLDAFAPVDLGQTGSWSPNGAAYAYTVAFETSLGWLFAGLLLGAATGVLRRD